MKIVTPAYEVDPKKQQAINDLKKGFLEVRRTIDILETDIHSSDDEKQTCAIWISGQFLYGCNKLFSDINAQIEEGAKRAEETSSFAEEEAH